MSAADPITEKISGVVSEDTEGGNPTSNPKLSSPTEPDGREKVYWKNVLDYSLAKNELLLSEFADLQRLNAIHLHNTLFNMRRDIWQNGTSSKTQMAELKTAMREYGMKLSNK